MSMMTVEIPELGLKVRQVPEGTALIYGDSQAQLLLPSHGILMQEVIDAIVAVAGANSAAEIRAEKWSVRRGCTQQQN